MIKHQNPGYVFIVVFMFCLLGILIYSHTFNSPFFFDDRQNIINNQAIRNLPDIYDIWRFDPTHFMASLSFALNYHFCLLHVFGYHLVNLIIHILTGIFVWYFASLTLSTPVMRQTKIAESKNGIALFSGLLFIAHPIQTEAVTYIVQRSTSLAAFFYMGSLGLYIKARLLFDTVKHSNIVPPGRQCLLDKDPETEGRSNGPQDRPWTYYILSLTAAVLGMFTKQIVITLPLAIWLYEFCFIRREKEKLSWKYIMPFLVLLLIVPVNVAVAKKTILWQVGELTKESDFIPRGVYLLTQFRVLITYLRLLVVPLRQTLDYDYPLSRSLGEVPALTSFLFLMCILIAGVLLFRRYRLLAFSIFWFFLTLSVESSFIPIRDVIFEHRLYLPMVGYSLFLPVVVYTVASKEKIRTGIIILIMLIGFYGFLTYARNRVWHSEFSLWNDVVKKSPGKARPYNSRGLAYLNMGEPEKALADFNRALMMNPYYVYAYNNRGLAYNSKKEYKKAITDFTKAIEIDPACVAAYNGRGDVYRYNKEHEKALADFNQALRINPQDAFSYNNRGLAYFDIGEKDKAISDFSQALKIDPGNLNAYNNRGIVYSNMGEYDRAIQDFSRALKIEPVHLESWYNRGSVYVEKKEYDKALADYNRVLEIEPGYVSAYVNRGIIYYYKKDYDNALADYNQALIIAPAQAEAYNNRAVLFFQRKEYDRAWADVGKVLSLGHYISPQFLEDLRRASGKEK